MDRQLITWKKRFYVGPHFRSFFLICLFYGKIKEVGGEREARGKVDRERRKSE